MKKLTKFLAVFLLALLGANLQPAWAWDISANCVYLDNHNNDWAKPQIHIYRSSDNQNFYYDLSQVSGTEYWVRTDSWGGFTGFELMGANTTYKTDWYEESITSPIAFTWTGTKWEKKAVGVKDVKLSDNGSTTYGGNGTSSTPYIIWPGEDIKTQMSCTKIAETNHTRQYQFEQNSFSTTDTYQKTTSTTSGTSYEIYGKARAVLTSNTSTTSREFSATSLHYTTATFYLIKSDGKNKGTKVGSMTRDGSGNYTYNWNCSTPGTYYFYVSTNQNSDNGYDFLGEATFANGTAHECWLYGTSNYAHVAKLVASYAGTYTFTFYKDSNSKYQFKCDYPAAYSSLSAVRTPEAAADAPQISNTIVAQGSSVTVTAKTPKTGYKFDNWTSSNGTFGTATDLSTTFTPNANNAVATANYSLINYSITYDPETASNFTYTTAPTSKTYGQSVEMEFTPAANYVIASVTAYKTGTPATTVTVTKTDDTHYSFTQPAYDVTVQVEVSLSSVQVTYGTVGNGSIIGKIDDDQIGDSPADVPGGSTVVFTATPDANYTVEGWYNNEGCTGDKLQEGDNTGNAQTYTIQNIAQAETVYVKFKETKYAVTIQTSTGIQSVEPSGSQQVGNVTPVQISAVVKEGYTWSQWTASSANVTITDASSVSTTIKATGDGTVTATATEKTVTLTPTVNDDNMGSVSAAGTVGIATGLQLNATKKNGYKFDHWVLSSNLAIQDSKTVYDNPITVKTNGDGNAVSAQAIFVEDLSTGVYLKGEGNFGGWDEAGFEFMKPTGHSTGNDAYVTIHTTGFEEFWMVDFALFDHGTTMVASGYYFFNSTIIGTLSHPTEGYENMKFFSTVAGDYVFHYNLSTKKLSIEYPHENCVAVNHTDSWSIHPLVDNEATINLDGSKSYKFCVIYDGAMYANLQNITDSQKELQLYNNYESFNNKIWINTVKGGNYVFNFDHANDDHLTVTYPEETYQTVTVYEDGYTPKEVKVYEVSKPSITAQVPEGMNFNGWVCTGDATVDNASATTTTVTNAGTNGTVKATFNTNKRIYLKGGSNFSDAYINFYKSNYWNSDLGSGNTGEQCVSKSNHMNKVTNTDIFWYDLNNNTTGWSNYFSFVNKGGEFHNFSMCNVVYRNDMKDALPFYVPRNSYASEHHNTSQYFNEGIWMKYNDTYSGYKLHIIETGSSENDYEFNAETPGGYEFKTTVSLKTGVTYKFKIVNENNTWYGASGQTMTATSCTNWKMHLDNDDCQITASETGNYTFILNLGSGEVIVSVEYPLSASDYRVVAKLGDEVKWEGDLIKNSGTTAKKDTTSFFNDQYTYQLQQYAGEGNWSDVTSQIVTPPDSAKQGVINFIVTQDGNGSATLAYEGIYTGNYYIRTDGVDGGWGDYENNSDNKMDNYGSLIDADPEYQYDVYKAKWITSGKNVKFRVANDYSKAISDELKGDAVIGNDKETLPQSANVRFMWNSTTNQLKRAYLSGSSNASDRYLILEGDAKMFDKDGKILTAVPQGGTTSDYAKVAGLNNYELNFDDKNNWVYQADIQAQPGCEVKLTAKYNNQIQYFIGAAGEESGSRRKIIDGSGTDKYSLRAVYDFKTNRLVVGWMPNGEITSSIELGSDMLIERTEHGDASQIVFGGSNPASLSISKIQHIYGVLKLTKETMIDNTKTDYEKSIYWISFPFDVKVSEIFGLDKYGEVWVISKYCGEKRAQKGWFKQDTESFWEFMGTDEIMKANVGYTLNLDPDYFNKDSSEPWKNSATEVAWYFPSMQENIGVVSLAQKDTTLLPQHCEIDREFNIGTEKESIMVNHKFTDSNWRVIGVPAFQNLQAPTFDPAPTPEQDKKIFGLTGFYEWQPSTNTYTAHTTDGYTFKATSAYMVQYAGQITWSNASAITTKNSAPWHASADSKSYSIKLEFGNEAYTDQTFVTLTEKASTDFVLNEDMMKIDNAGYPNIYSFAGNYNVAYNETKMDNQTVTLGVSAPKAGTYTFAMPNQFSGTAKLIDLVEGITTDLNVSNYSVDLNKGTYNDRFQLLLEVEAKAPTSMENVDSGWWMVDGKTLKLLRNGNIYLINAGRVYNATGAELR